MAPVAVGPSVWPTPKAIVIAAIAVGAVTDAFGSLSYALNVSAAMLGVGAIAAAFQGRLGRKS